MDFCSAKKPATCSALPQTCHHHHRHHSHHSCPKPCRAPRDLIYASLLRSMSPEHKFSSAAKLCGEVLAGVADGLLPLAECEEVLRDALSLLASKDIKVCYVVTACVILLLLICNKRRYRIMRAERPGVML